MLQVHGFPPGYRLKPKYDSSQMHNTSAPAYNGPAYRQKSVSVGSTNVVSNMDPSSVKQGHTEISRS